MKKIRMAMMAAAMVCGAATMAAAQGGGAAGAGGAGGQARGMGRGNPQAQMQALFKDITLTESQQKQVDSIAAASREQQQAMMQAAQQGGDRQAMMAKFQEMRTKLNDAYKAILTDEQKKQFEKNLAEMPQGRRGGGR